MSECFIYKTLHLFDGQLQLKFKKHSKKDPGLVFKNCVELSGCQNRTRYEKGLLTGLHSPKLTLLGYFSYQQTFRWSMELMGLDSAISRI